LTATDSHASNFADDGTQFLQHQPPVAGLSGRAFAPSESFRNDPVLVPSSQSMQGTGTAFTNTWLPVGAPVRSPSTSEKEVISYPSTAEKEVITADAGQQSDRMSESSIPSSSLAAELAQLRAEQAKIAERKSRLMQLHTLDEEEEAIRRQIALIAGQQSDST
jgi:hypothetical protein